LEGFLGARANSACTRSVISFTEKSSGICTVFDDVRKYGCVNPAYAGHLQAGLLPHAVAGAVFETRVGRTQPHWIGCDLRSYRLRLAETEAERAAACRLRFRVFNLELGEGLSEFYANG
jgi:hypothetical protein